MQIDESNILIRTLKSIPFPLRFILVLSITLLIGVSDYFTGNEYSFSIFYLIPITVAVFIHGGKVGFIFSFISASIWILVDIISGSHYSSGIIPFWNAGVRLAYFLFHTMLLSSLIKSRNESKALSFYDPLTKAANRRFFEEYSKTVLKTAEREKQTITLAYMDVDNFKEVNDTYGHDTGDDLLRIIAQTIESEIRPTDMLARLGGDEFAILLTNLDYKESEEVMKRIRNALTLKMQEREWHTTFSIGVLLYTALPPTIDLMIRDVDQLMYEVKNNGKNGVKIKINGGV